MNDPLADTIADFNSIDYDALKARSESCYALAINRDHDTMTFHAVDHQGHSYSNNKENRASAVTWGVFPNKEIKQPTVVDPQAFEVWKDEVSQRADNGAATHPPRALAPPAVAGLRLPSPLFFACMRIRAHAVHAAPCPTAAACAASHRRRSSCGWTRGDRSTRPSRTAMT